VFVLCTHHDPDIDGVGSALALSIYLKGKGDKVVTLLESFPEYMHFLNGKENLNPALEIKDLDNYTLIALDCASRDRVWPNEILDKAGRIINVDHHSDNTKFGDVNIVNPEVSSTAELLYNIFKVKKIELSVEVCENIYAGILFDTGGFRYQNTNHETFLISTELLLKGVIANKISEFVFDRWDEGGFKALYIALRNIEYFGDGKILFSFIPYEEIKGRNLKSDDFESIVDILRSDRKARIVIFVREIKKNLFKGSIRSKEEISVNHVAQKLGGGGHSHAAGFEAKATDISSIKKKILKEALSLTKK